MKMRPFVSILSIILAGQGWAALPITEPLWQGNPPGARAEGPSDRPTLTLYIPEPNVATGTAVIICPGGGYAHLAIDHEGQQVATWLNGLGVLAGVLRYRHNGDGYKHPIPMWDAQRAIRLVRYKAASLGIRPDRIGILGFSAGGHLASTVATHVDKAAGPAADPIDQLSSRPDFAILIYPVITMYPPYCHMGSRQNLLGENPDPALIELFSNERQVGPDTPPTFLVHGGDDKTVPVENSILFYQALRKASVKAEMHVFLESRHGFGLGSPGSAVSQWPGLCQQWMKAMGLLDGGHR